MKRSTHKILKSPVYRLIVSGVIVGMPLMGPAIVPFSITRVWAETLATQSIGMVQGTGTITQNHLDIPLSGGKFPLADGAKITTEAGVIRVLFPGRNWVQLGPYGSMTITRSTNGYVVKIEGGEVKFHLNQGNSVSFETPSSRVFATDQDLKDGSILVTSSNIISVSMKKGEVRVEDLANKKEFLANSGNPVVLGANSLEIIPTSSDEIVAEGSSELPSGAVPLYGADGHCVGYMTKNGGFVSAPGIVTPLSHPISQASLSKVPNLPSGAKPLFDKHGKYMGYANKGLFVYDDPPDDNESDKKKKRRRAAAIILGTLAAGVVGFTAAGISGAFTSHPGAPVTPVTPILP
ncbi:hypothetical protein [Methylacidiphilum caldifontis]|uniref:FecR protein domain-containing protein n=1 Tax=Methylacidiphilum caldifontis TaxID=2795386 RepID=A0A4Y8P7Z1_9BACT|nr:hypothetical protein [Methylacidiphilum caldifontis]TFE66570.1 hypothetical protein A7Q10_02000 [Methylacidiphilum caldifontis]